MTGICPCRTDWRSPTDWLNGLIVTQIAAGIGKHPSTVSREIARHSIDGLYLPYRADQGRRGRPGPAQSSPNW